MGQCVAALNPSQSIIISNNRALELAHRLHRWIILKKHLYQLPEQLSSRYTRNTCSFFTRTKVTM